MKYPGRTWQNFAFSRKTIGERNQRQQSLCGQSTEFLVLNLRVRILTTRLWRVAAGSPITTYIYCRVLHNYKVHVVAEYCTQYCTGTNTAIGGQRYPVQQPLRNRSTDLKLSPETRKLYCQWNQATSKSSFFVVFPQSLQANSRMLPLKRHHRDFLPSFQILSTPCTDHEARCTLNYCQHR